jgi:anti-sigma factor RsiW
MSECEILSDLLEGYLRGSLSREERGRLEEHVNACKACEKALREHLALHKALESVPECEIPADFTEVVLSRIEKSRLATYGSWKLSALAALVLVFLCAAVALSSLFFDASDVFDQAGCTLTVQAGSFLEPASVQETVNELPVQLGDGLAVVRDAASWCLNLPLPVLLLLGFALCATVNILLIGRFHLKRKGVCDEQENA